jgi:hypothetical protein
MKFSDTTVSDACDVPACAVARPVAHKLVAVLSQAARVGLTWTHCTSLTAVLVKKKSIDFPSKFLLNLQPFFLFLEHIIAFLRINILDSLSLKRSLLSYGIYYLWLSFPVTFIFLGFLKRTRFVFVLSVCVRKLQISPQKINPYQTNNATRKDCQRYCHLGGL